MKTFIVALLVLVIILTGVFIYSDYIKRVDSSLREIIESIEKNADKEEWNTAEKELRKLIDIWKKDEKILAMFNDHEDLDKISLEISDLSESIHHRDTEHTKKAIEKIRVLIERVVKNESMSPENILNRHKIKDCVILCSSRPFGCLYRFKV